MVLTPHAADLLNEGVVDNVIAFLEGRPRKKTIGETLCLKEVRP